MTQLPRPAADLRENTLAYENQAFIDPHGFREYDARWELGTHINLNGFHYLGRGLATQLTRHHGPNPSIVVGHDYRSYSLSIKYALISGLMAGGCRVVDAGLALTPTLYYAQLALQTDGLAMVTASHNDNGWSGVKMGLEPRLTHGPEQMAELKEIVLQADFVDGAGTYQKDDTLAAAYVADLARRFDMSGSKPLKVVLACGNGTPGAFAPELFRQLGCEVVDLYTELDNTYPHFNPNPENNAFMESLAAEVKRTGADLGLAFDGDGDRVGVADHTGQMIYNDKLALLLARHLARQNPGSQFVVDVKSTGLFAVDDVLAANNCTVSYWKTGHSHIKRRVAELGALAGFEKSGHFFFNQPVGEGYDDGLFGGLMVLQMLAESGKSLAELLAELPATWQSPTYHPHCADDQKYGVVEQVVDLYTSLHKQDYTIGGQSIAELVTVNGVRIILADGTWGLVRASSNVPALVITAESPHSADALNAMLADINQRLVTLQQSEALPL